MTFADRLTRAMEKAGLDQSKLARASRVSRGTINAWLNNPHQRHEWDKLERVAAVLDVAPEDLERQDAEAEQITTPARLHSWLNEHLERVIEAEVDRRFRQRVETLVDDLWDESSWRLWRDRELARRRRGEQAQ